MKNRILLVMVVMVWVSWALEGHAELQVVQPDGVTVVPGHKIPHGEQDHNSTEQTAAATFDVATILKQTATYEQQCLAPEVGEAGPFPSAMLKLKTLFAPIKGRAYWLPPDPGRAGKTTIEGIDSDGDCVRDDIEYFIARKFPNREQLMLRKHLFKLAKYLGLFLQPNMTREAAAYYSANMFVATECARREMSQVTTASKDLDMIFGKFHNTLDRSYRYIENSAQLGGTSSRIPDDINCDSLPTSIITK
jgi:hypothetical protein